ncbi:PorT family protein [Bacteroidales bacterium OttesenSCG-928-I21]|nr:PorT family protein [Bacteroidales bacterium OttesenSCG-928-I21]
MKKGLLLVYLILFVFLLNAQSFRGGLNLGFNISQVDGDNHGGYRKISPAGGLFVRNDFKHPNWGMSLAILYKNKGSRATFRDDNGDIIGKYSINLHYIEIPIMFDYFIEKIGIPGLFNYNFKNDLHFEFGPSLGYLVKGLEEIDKVDLKRMNFKKFEIALHVGLVYRLSPHWLLNYRFSYTFPFTPIHPHAGGQTRGLNRGMYNNNMNFSVCYEF